jgi:hypothetical protein
MRYALFWDLRSINWWFLADVLGQLLAVVKFSQWCWWRFKSSVTLRPVDWSIYPPLQGEQSKMKALRSTETSITHQSTGRSLHQHLTVMFHSTEDRAGPSYCVWRVFYGSLKITAALTKVPYWNVTQCVWLVIYRMAVRTIIVRCVKSQKIADLT